MSVREEDRKKNSCPSRGLGIAAAALGVGVGAALYYFFSKRQENPNSEGSSSDWNCERQQAFRTSESDDSYTTISEHDTSDTSMNQSEDSFIVFEEDTSVNAENSTTERDSQMDTDDEDVSTESNPDSELEAAIAISLDMYRDSSFEMTSPRTSDSESDHREWDITTTSSEVPNDMSWLRFLQGGIAERGRGNRKTQDELMAIKRQEAFRERSWTLEECSICFEVMLKNQDVTSLPCAHNFHTDCIMPWLQEKQTCPNCRKVAE